MAVMFEEETHEKKKTMVLYTQFIPFAHFARVWNRGEQDFSLDDFSFQ